MAGRACIECASPFRELMLLRWKDALPDSLNAAAMAAWAVVEEAVALTLFLRLTRWLGLLADKEME